MHVRITQINVKQVNLEAKHLVHSDTLKYDTHSHKPTARVQGFNNGTAVAVAGAGCRAVLCSPGMLAVAQGSLSGCYHPSHCTCLLFCNSEKYMGAW